MKKYLLLLTFTSFLFSSFQAYSQSGCSGIDFTADIKRGCRPLLVSFNATGFPSGSTFEWDFGTGNGYVSGKDTARKIYTDTGKFDVSLRVTLPSGTTTCTPVVKKDLIEVLNTPAPRFSIQPSNVLCDGPRTIGLVDSTPNGQSRDWVIGGTSIKNASPIDSYKVQSIGLNNVTLSVTSPNGCTGTKTKKNYLKVYDSIEYGICAQITQKHTKKNVIFSAGVKKSFRQSVDSFIWKFPGGSPGKSTAPNPQVVYNKPNATYPVTLKVKGKTGCSFSLTRKDFITQYVSVSKDTVCAREFLTAKNLVNSQGRKNFNWFLGNAEILSGKVHTGYTFRYKSAGYKDFLFNFRYGNDPCFTQVVYDDAIYVKKPVAEFFSPDRFGCLVPDTVLFNSNTTLPSGGTATYKWYFFDSNGQELPGSPIGPGSKQQIDYIFKTQAEYGVALVVEHTNGCRDSLFEERYVRLAEPTATFEATEDTLCAGELFQLSTKVNPPDNSMNPYQYDWVIKHSDSSISNKKIASGKKPYIRLNMPGEYDVTLIVKNSQYCGDTITKKRFLKVHGTAGLINVGNRNGCLPHKSNLQGKIITKYPKNFNQLSYEWTIDPKKGANISNPYSLNTQVAFTRDTCYKVYLYVEDQYKCRRRYQQTSDICVGMKAELDHQKKFCRNEKVWFKDVSNDIRKADSRQWSVDPAKYVEVYPHDSAKRIEIKFKKDTCYKVTLSVQAKAGNEICTDKFSEKICVHSPIVDFYSRDTVTYCAPAIVNFVNKTTGKASNFIWDFGDGTTLSKRKKIISHSYSNNKPTGYDVKLIAVDNSGCSDTMIKKNYVHIYGPVPKYVPSVKTGCDSINVTFKNKSINVKNYYVDYDDGSPLDSNQINPHKYRIPDPSMDSVVYSPILLAIGNFGCKSFYRDTIVVYKKPKVGFKVDTSRGCPPLKITFTDTTHITKDHYWDFTGDGVPDTNSKTVKRRYDSVGKYSVGLDIVTRGGCTNSLVKKDRITVIKGPEAKLALSSTLACDSLTVRFKNQSIDDNAFIINYGDSTADTNVIHPHHYSFDYTDSVNSFQLFPVKFVAIRNAGCKDTTYKTVQINRDPIPEFSVNPQADCAPVNAIFTDKTLFSDKILWDVNNDGIYDDNGKYTSYSFKDTGAYSTKLVVELKNGCKDSVIRDSAVVAHSYPQARIGMNGNKFCGTDSIQFTDQTRSRANITQWKWVIYDNDNRFVDSQHNENPVFQVGKSGEYRVELSVADQFGCGDKTSENFEVIKDTFPSDAKLAYTTVTENQNVKTVWNKNTKDDFHGYYLFRTGTDPTNLIHSTSGESDTTFTDQNPGINVREQPYCYYLKSKDKCGNPVLLGPPHCNIFLKVTSFSPVANLLSWSAYQGWKNVKNYSIYRSIDSIDYELIKTVDGDVHSYTDFGLCDTSYFYYVVAHHPNNKHSSRSNLDSSKPAYVYQDVPVTLENVTVEDNQNIRVSWERAKQPNVKGYILNRKDPVNGLLENYAMANDTFFVDENVAVNKNAYQYRVRVRDKCGHESPLSNPGLSILLSSTVNKREDNIDLDWNPYKKWPEGVKQYKVEFENARDKFKPIGFLDSNTTKYSDHSFHPEIDSAYCYRIKAIEIGDVPDTSVSNIECNVLPSRIYVPNAFSPNNDGLNDTFRVSTLSVYKNESIKFIRFRLKVDRKSVV